MALKQYKYHLAGACMGAVMIALPVVCGLDGIWLTAKPDTLAHGIPTVCYGETENVQVGDTYTRKQCADMLVKKLPRYADEIAACIKLPVSDETFAAYVDFAYNVGSAGFCHSQVLKRLNRGDRIGSCEAMGSWTIAGGKVRQGLVNRRRDEIALCKSGIN